MQVSTLINAIRKQGVSFFTGVPDSLLKPFCNYLYEEEGISKGHIIAPNEGSALALAAGEYLSTGNPACVYMQNSGLGNIVNPMCSLMHPKVYGIPAILVVGWRGEPGVHDEPQHVFQGEVTLETLALLGVKAIVLSKEMEEADFLAQFALLAEDLKEGKCIAIVVKKGALTSPAKPVFHSSGSLGREEAIQVLAKQYGDQGLFVSSTGKISRELFEQRKRLGQKHEDFLTVGSMGHCCSIALRVAQCHPEKQVFCLDGDGALLMHMGAMALIGANRPKNLVHIVLDNGAHETVGGMPTVADQVDFCQIARACGYERVLSVASKEGLEEALDLLAGAEGLAFLHVQVALGAREDLGRPTRTPAENRQDFMNKAMSNEL